MNFLQSLLNNQVVKISIYEIFYECYEYLFCMWDYNSYKCEPNLKNVKLFKDPTYSLRIVWK